MRWFLLLQEFHLELEHVSSLRAVKVLLDGKNTRSKASMYVCSGIKLANRSIQINRWMNLMAMSCSRILLGAHRSQLARTLCSKGHNLIDNDNAHKID